MRASFDAKFQVTPKAAVVLSLLLVGCASGGSTGHTSDTSSGSLVGQRLPDLEAASLYGSKPVRTSELRGKVVLLDLWASWCAPCKEELPMLDDMAARLRAKGIEIVAVSIDENREDAEQFLRSRPRWTLRLGHDGAQKIPGRLSPPKMPTSYIIDKKGVVRQVNAGFERADVSKIEARLNELAAGS